MSLTISRKTTVLANHGAETETVVYFFFHNIKMENCLVILQRHQATPSPSH